MFGSTKHESRKLVDLLFRANGLYASLEPSIPITPGDYGTVDRETGVFFKEGNIFDSSFLPYLVQTARVSKHASSLKSNSEVAGGVGSTPSPGGRDKGRDTEVVPLQVDMPQTYSTERKVVVQTEHVKLFDVGLDVSADFLPLASIEFAVSAKFSRERSLAIILAHSQIKGLLNKAQLRAVLQLPILKGKALVGEVYECPGFVLIAHSGNEAEAKIAFGAKMPVAAATGLPVVAGGGPEYEWKVTSSTKLSREGVNGNFYPLMRLYSCAPHVAAVRLRGKVLHAAEEVEVPLPLFFPPWEDLDDNGEEINIGDSDDDLDFRI